MRESFKSKTLFSFKNMTYKFKPSILLTLFVISLLASCIPQKETLYLQEKEAEMEFTPATEITGKYVLQPNDYLFIHVTTPDPKLSEFFNAQQGGNVNQSQGNTMFLYMIDDDMNIDFPYVGLINLKGANIFEAKEIIKAKLKPFLSDGNLIVRLGSNYFTLLGEVKSPGQKKMNRDQITIFEAIGMGSDLTVYGKKRDIRIIRPQPDGKTLNYTVDLTDERIIDSEYYYIYPNDVIYIRPMKAKMWGIGESVSLGILTSLLALTLTIMTIASYSK